MNYKNYNITKNEFYSYISLTLFIVIKEYPNSSKFINWGEKNPLGVTHQVTFVFPVAPCGLEEP